MNRKKLGISIVVVVTVGVSVLVGIRSASDRGDVEQTNMNDAVESVPPSTYEVVVASSSRFIDGDEVLCGLDDQFEFIKEISGLDDIPPPVLAEGGDTRYVSENIELRFDPCEMMGVLAHEVAHYILDRYHRFDIDQHLADALANFCPGGPVEGRCSDGWIIFGEPHLGAEHAAHCIGNVLVGSSGRTNCPSESLRALARDRIERAKTLPPSRVDS